MTKENRLIKDELRMHVCVQEKDVYLLDDPLSAVDVHVAQHLYSECLVGLLHCTTRILVTHHVHFLHDADFIVVVEGGKIRQIGPYFIHSTLCDRLVVLIVHRESMLKHRL